MSTIIGIDLGTTYSAVARLNDLGKPEILLNREGERITPSVVLFQGEEPLVGQMAKRSAATAPLDVVQFVKRHVGDPGWRFRTTGDEEFTPEDISAIILKRLKADAEMMLGEPVTDAVITVPAYFDDARRRATQDAGVIAGLNVRRVLNEPTAAALAYGLESEASGTFLVYDLGGGTFDVTIMRVADREFEVKATLGDRNLGGFDWDNAVMNWANEQFQAQGAPDLYEDDRTEAELREKAEMAKRALTNVATTKIFMSASGFSGSVELTRATFDELTASLLNRTKDITEMALEDAGFAWSAIDKLLLVGGSTRMPQVRAMIEQLSGRGAERSIHPDEVVALGAAVQAALLDDSGTHVAGRLPDGKQVAVTDVTSQGLGVIIRSDDNLRDVNSVILPHNTPIPAQRASDYMTVVDNQTSLDVRITEGDDDDPDYVTLVGRAELRIPPYPKHSPIRVVLSYDFDGLIHVEVVDLAASQSLGEFEIDRESNLSDDERESKRRRLDVMGEPA